MSNESQSSTASPYAPGGIVVGPNGGDSIQVYIGPCESFITAADVRALQQASDTERHTRALSEAVSRVQSGIDLMTWNLWDYELRTAIERDNRLNTEEKRVYHDTLIELEFGEGFFRRAHP